MSGEEPSPGCWTGSSCVGATGSCGLTCLASVNASPAQETQGWVTGELSLLGTPNSLPTSFPLSLHPLWLGLGHGGCTLTSPRLVHVRSSSSSP